MQLVKKFIILITVLSFPFVFSISTFATTPQESIRVTPSYISLTEKSGSNTYENLSIFNNSNSILNLNISKKGIEYKHKKLILINSKLKSNVQNWISIQTTKVSIQPHKTQNIPVYIAIPKNEKYGSYNGGIIISNIPQSQVGNFKVFGRIIVNVFINIRGKNKGYSNLYINNLKYTTFTMTSPINIKYQVFDPGPYNNAFIAQAYISSITNSKIKKTSIINILKGQTRYKTITLNHPYIGINNIKLTLHNIGDNKYYTKNLAIFYIPKYLINIAIIVLIVVLILMFIKLTIKHKHIPKH